MSTDVDEEVVEFTFDALSTKAKEKARDKWRETALQDEWWDHVYGDAVRIGALMGLEIGEKVNYTLRGAPMRSPDIWFSGFSSQGDGCCWSGWIVADKLAGAIQRVKDEAPCDEELHDLAARCEELFGMIAGIAAFNRLCDDDTNRDWPDVEMDMRINVEGKERGYATCTIANDLPVDLENFADALVEDFASWIYSQLEAEHDYQLSDDVIDEQIECACLVFHEDGNEL